MTNEDRLAELEQQLGQVISAIQVVAEQKKNTDLSAENQALRQALANSTELLRKSVESATSKLDSYQTMTSQKTETISKALTNLQESDEKLNNAVRAEIAKLLPQIHESVKSASKTMEGAAVTGANSVIDHAARAGKALVESTKEARTAITELQEDAISARSSINMTFGIRAAWIGVAVLGGAILGFFLIGSLIPLLKWYPDSVKRDMVNSAFIQTVRDKTTADEWKTILEIHDRK